MSRMGVSRLDLMYAHISDPAVALSETVEGFAELVSLGMVGLLGVSNHWAWMVERARGWLLLPGCGVRRCCSTAHVPAAAGGFAFVAAPDGEPGAAGPDLLSYVRPPGCPGGVLAAAGGAYVRRTAAGPELPHAGRAADRGFVRRASETGATPNQVVLRG